MKQRDVSVVIPAYNAQGFIADALESLARQTEPPREVIVIDDGSRDETSAAVRSWAASRELTFELHLHRQDNGGIAAARNHGISRSHGAWIALLDADDIWDERHVELLFAGLQHKPEAVLSYGAGRLFRGSEIQELPYDDFWDNPSKKFGLQFGDSPFYAIGRDVFPRLIKGNFIKPSSLMFLRAAARSVGDFRVALGTAEDREFLARLLLTGGFIYCSTPITLYRWHDDNASQGKNARRNIGFGLRAIHMVLEEHRDKLSRNEIKACKQAILDTSRIPGGVHQWGHCTIPRRRALRSKPDRLAGHAGRPQGPASGRQPVPLVAQLSRVGLPRRRGVRRNAAPASTAGPTDIM